MREKYEIYKKQLYKDICSRHMPFSYYISAIFISLSIVFTFGTVFVGAFAVAVIAFGGLFYEICDAVQGKKSVLQFFDHILCGNRKSA